MRDLDNPLPFAWIGVERRSAGLRLGWTRTIDDVTMRIGMDAAMQRDERLNADNADGMRGETTSLDQLERVRSVGASVVVDWAPTAYLSASAGLRLDRMRVRMDDRLTSDGDQSGERTFGALSPGVSVRWAAPGWSAYAGWSTAFDAPTTTELVNTPDGSSGFNPALGPQHTRGVETGFRAGAGSWRLDFSLYRLRVRDLMSSYQDQESGRTYFLNAGTARHSGAEILYEWTPTNRIRFLGFAAFQRFRYDDGNELPGLPGRRMGASLEAGADLVRGEIRVESVSARWGDDANTGRIEDHVVLDVRFFHTGFTTGMATWRPFVEVRNVLDRRYAASVVVNARGGRWYEPAPGRTLTAGLSVRIR